MNKRQERIIKLLEDSGLWMTGKEISKIMNVSDRTIRSDIDTINRYYEKSLIESSLRNGYRINREVLSSLPLQITPMIPQTPDQRYSFVLQELLRNKEVNLLDLQDQVFISGYTVDNDLKIIKEKLKPYDGLKIIRSKSTIQLKGDEQVKRKLYKDLLRQETEGNFLNLNGIVSLFHEFDLLRVKDKFEKILADYDYQIRGMSYPMLLMHIGVYIDRMMHHNYVDTIIDVPVNNSLEYQIAQDLFTQLSKELPIEYSDAEVRLLALLMMGKRSKNYIDDIIEWNGQIYSVSQLVDSMLQAIYQEYGINFLEDQDLQNGLVNHVRAFLERKKRKIGMENVYLSQIKKKYPLVFELGICAAKTLSTSIDSTISENEIGFMALHLGSAYEKRYSSEKYRVLMLFPDEMKFRTFSIQKIERSFFERVAVVDLVSLFEETYVKRVRPDLILTTLPLKHELEIPTVQISPLVDQDDEGKVFSALNQLDKQRNKERFEHLILDLFEPAFFHTDVCADSKESILHQMCIPMEQADYVDAHFESSVLAREKLSSTSFQYGFALPHALNMEARQSCISVAILNQSVLWNEYPVRLVILLAIKDKDRKLLRVFFDWFTEVVSDSLKMSRLLQAKNREEFLECILED